MACYTWLTLRRCCTLDSPVWFRALFHAYFASLPQCFLILNTIAFAAVALHPLVPEQVAAERLPILKDYVGKSIPVFLFFKVSPEAAQCIG